MTWRALFLALAVGGLCGGPSAQTAPRDDLGRPADAGRPAMSIVDRLPSPTESVCALDACARLVGADRESNWPARGAVPPALQNRQGRGFESGRHERLLRPGPRLGEAAAVIADCPVAIAARSAPVRP